MKISKINDFCKHYEIDLDSLSFYPGSKREIWMFLKEDDFARIYPQEPSDATEEELQKWEEEKEAFHDVWWYVYNEYGEPAFNVYY